MTRKQIKITLVLEGVYYCGITMVLLMTVGEILSYLIFLLIKKWRDIFCGLFFSGSTDVVCVCDSGDRMCNRTPCSSSFGIKRELGGTSEKRAGLRKKGVI